MRSPAERGGAGVEMIGVQGAILAEIADRRMTREDVALTYAFGLRGSEQIDWAAVNRAIMDRWSFSGLEWIKKRAWQLVGQPGAVA